MNNLLKNNKSSLYHPLFEVLIELFADKQSPGNLVVLPKRFDLAAWTGIWHAVLQNLKMSERTDPKSLSFKKGQKLLVNNVICLFDSLAPKKKRIKLKIKYPKGNALHTVPFSKIYRLHPVDPSVPLTTATTFVNKNSEGVSLIFGTSATLHGVVITKLKEFRKAYGQIKGLNLVSCAKLDEKGKIVPLEGHMDVFYPDCLISSDISRLFNYLQSEKNVPRHVLIDGSKSILDNLLQFKSFILERNIPVTVFIDHKEKTCISEFEDLGFKVINEREWANRITYPKKTEFEYINHAFKAAESIRIEKTVFKNERLEKSNEILNKACKSRLYEKIMEYYDQARKDLIHLSRSILKEKYIRNDRIDKLKTTFPGNREVAELVSLLELLDEEKKERMNGNKKIDYLKKIIESYPKTSKIIVVQNEQEKECWEKIILLNKWTKVRVETPDFFRSDYIPFEKMFVSGYLGPKKMNQIITSYVCHDIHVLLWEHEAGYFDYFYKNCFGKILGGEKNNKIDETDNKNTHSSFTGKKTKTMEIDFDGYAGRDFHKRYSTNNSKLADKAIFIQFENEYYGYFTITYPLYKLYENEGKVESVKEIKPTQIKQGDQIIYIKSCSDKIKKFVDEQLLQNNLSLRETANLWQTALRMKYKEKRNNLEQLCNLLRMHGLKRNKVTVNNWLKKDMIGPADMKDIDIIAEATDYEPLKSRVNEVKEAIISLRSAHHQASRILINEVLHHIQENSQEIAASSETDDSNEEYQVYVVKDIQKEFKNIKKSHVNKIMKREG